MFFVVLTCIVFWATVVLLSDSDDELKEVDVATSAMLSSSSDNRVPIEHVVFCDTLIVGAGVGGLYTALRVGETKKNWPFFVSDG